MPNSLPMKLELGSFLLLNTFTDTFILREISFLVRSILNQMEHECSNQILGNVSIHARTQCGT